MHPPTMDFSKWLSSNENLKDPANYQSSLTVESNESALQTKYEETIKMFEEQKIKFDEEQSAHKVEKKKLSKKKNR
jgi:hypothetical protein